jgi:hypothetical protein
MFLSLRKQSMEDIDLCSIQSWTVLVISKKVTGSAGPIFGAGRRGLPSEGSAPALLQLLPFTKPGNVCPWK